MNKTVDIKYEAVVREMEVIENEAGISFNDHRKIIARHIINHFTSEHLPPPKTQQQFEIPKELLD